MSKIGIPGLHFHDLRPMGNMLAAPGASLAIAEALDKRITGSQKTDQGRDDDDGAAGVLAKTG